VWLLAGMVHNLALTDEMMPRYFIGASADPALQSFLLILYQFYSEIEEMMKIEIKETR
jgi:hypothetical protein